MFNSLSLFFPVQRARRFDSPTVFFSKMFQQLRSLMKDGHRPKSQIKLHPLKAQVRLFPPGELGTRGIEFDVKFLVRRDLLPIFGGRQKMTGGYSHL